MERGEQEKVSFLIGVENSNDPPKSFTLRRGTEGVVTIGRLLESDVLIPLRGVSSVHAELRLRDAGESATPGLEVLSVRDVSMNGTGIACPGKEMVLLKKGVDTPLPDGAVLHLPLRVKGGCKERFAIWVRLERRPGSSKNESAAPALAVPLAGNNALSTATAASPQSSTTQKTPPAPQQESHGLPAQPAPGQWQPGAPRDKPASSAPAVAGARAGPPQPMDSQGNAWVCAGVCSAQGVRPTHEDAHLILCDWHQVPGPAALFAVFDGHGGPAAAQHASSHLAGELQEEVHAHGWASEDARCGAAECAFLALDQALRRDLGAERLHHCGSTCVAAVVWPEGAGGAAGGSTRYRLQFSNVGDSRGLLARGGGLIGQTTDHKPDAPDELQRIREAGGDVTTSSMPGAPPRVDGVLACARALGDFRFKDDTSRPPERQKVSPLPDACEFACWPGDIVVLACDGVFDVLTSAEVAGLVCSELPAGTSAAAPDLALVAKAVVDEALRRNTLDNVTCLVAQLH
eukprot:CAMPEP_0179257578 /NCGR_PEP_ID=MMETSP0797-20121207/24861_1 /TAXON_ID=47934 /ORGANISM="Dinophysis acuminata, Strain DAEP01" /LENGTH=516 /DNA_ID=CAMNT_0020965561 /DNA_START=154 /DNA_END=1704 /DNA_ORIENTATION=+